MFDWALHRPADADQKQPEREATGGATSESDFDISTHHDMLIFNLHHAALSVSLRAVIETNHAGPD
jgi:hypothetical protein